MQKKIKKKFLLLVSFSFICLFIFMPRAAFSGCDTCSEKNNQQEISPQEEEAYLNELAETNPPLYQVMINCKTHNPELYQKILRLNISGGNKINSRALQEFKAMARDKNKLAKIKAELKKLKAAYPDATLSTSQAQEKNDKLINLLREQLSAENDEQ